jgi:hypothetical protein
MLGDLDNKSKYLESIDNGEENLEIRLENLKKNDWKRMNSPAESDNRLGLVHMGFECSIHDIYDPQFTDKTTKRESKNMSNTSWGEDHLWESDEETVKMNFKTVHRKKKLSLSKSPLRVKKCLKIERWSVDDNEEYQRIKENKGAKKEIRKLYDKVKNQFSDFYDIEFIDQVWQMRDLRGQDPVSVKMRTPSPKKSMNNQINYSSNSKFNVSRTYSNTDSLNIKLSCINNPISEIGSEWNESVMGLLDNLPDSNIQRNLNDKGRIIQHKLNSQQYKNLLADELNRKSENGFMKSDIKFEENSVRRGRKKEAEIRESKKAKSNSKNKQKKFRKRKGISGTNSLSEMTGMFEDELSNFMSNLDQIPIMENKIKPEVENELNTERENQRTETLFNLTTQTSKNWEQDQKGLNGLTIVTKSIDEQELKNNLVESQNKKLEVEPIMQSEVLRITNISEQIKQIAEENNLNQEEIGKDRLSHREMAVSAERGLNFLIENWKELGTLQNPPNTLEQFSEKKENKKMINTPNLREVLRSVRKEKLKEPIVSIQQKPLIWNPEHVRPDCFMKKGVVNVTQKNEKLGTPVKQKKGSKKGGAKESSKKKSGPSNRSTPQNGKKVQVPQLNYPFSNFYLPNSKKIFKKSISNFSKVKKQTSGLVTPIHENLKTISDNFLFENNPPKSHRQFSNKKRLRNDALKKKLKMNSKKKNSKELQKILEFKKNLVSGRKVESKIEDSLRRLKTKKLESKCFQSDRNLSIQKSK